MSFLATDLAYAAPFEGAQKPVSAGELLALDPLRLEIPSQYAKLQEVHQGKNGTLLIHIQDAHSNLSGQENLARTLDEVLSRYKVDLVLVEGGAGDVSLTPIKGAAPADVWKKVAKSFLIQGKLSGEEYLNLASEHPMRIQGIEDEDLYFESLRAYSDLTFHRAQTLEYLARIRRSVEKIKQKIYPAELLDYEKKDHENFEDRFEELLKLSQPDGFPSLQKLASLKEEEKRIDFDLANLERAALIEEIAKRGGGGDLKKHLEAAQGLKGDKLSQFAHFQSTLEIAQKRNIDLSKYPALLKYGEYLKEFTMLDLEAVLEEMERFENGVYPTFLTTQDQRLIRAVDRHLALLQTAFQIRMTTKEFETFRANDPDFGTIPYLSFVNRKLAELGYAEDLIAYENVVEEGKKALEAFYGSVTKRDFAFIENTDKILKEKNEKVAVLISGGYHTPHLKELFKEKGYSYAVLTPVVTQETIQAKYERLLLAPLQNGKKISASQNSSRKNNDGIRRLAAAQFTDGTITTRDELIMAAARLTGDWKPLQKAGARLADIRDFNEDEVDEKLRVLKLPSKMVKLNAQEGFEMVKALLPENQPKWIYETPAFERLPNPEPLRIVREGEQIIVRGEPGSMQGSFAEEPLIVGKDDVFLVNRKGEIIYFRRALQLVRNEEFFVKNGISKDPKIRRYLNKISEVSKDSLLTGARLAEESDTTRDFKNTVKSGGFVSELAFRSQLSRAALELLGPGNEQLFMSSGILVFMDIAFGDDRNGKALAAIDIIEQASKMVKEELASHFRSIQLKWAGQAATGWKKSDRKSSGARLAEKVFDLDEEIDLTDRESQLPGLHSFGTFFLSKVTMGMAEHDGDAGRLLDELERLHKKGTLFGPVDDDTPDFGEFENWETLLKSLSYILYGEVLPKEKLVERLSQPDRTDQHVLLQASGMIQTLVGFVYLDHVRFRFTLGDFLRDNQQFFNKLKKDPSELGDSVSDLSEELLLSGDLDEKKKEDLERMEGVLREAEQDQPGEAWKDRAEEGPVEARPMPDFDVLASRVIVVAQGIDKVKPSGARLAAQKIEKELALFAVERVNDDLNASLRLDLKAKGKNAATAYVMGLKPIWEAIRAVRRANGKIKRSLARAILVTAKMTALHGLDRRERSVVHAFLMSDLTDRALKIFLTLMPLPHQAGDSQVILSKKSILSQARHAAIGRRKTGARLANGEAHKFYLLRYDPLKLQGELLQAWNIKRGEIKTYSVQISGQTLPKLTIQPEAASQEKLKAYFEVILTALDSLTKKFEVNLDREKLRDYIYSLIQAAPEKDRAVLVKKFEAIKSGAAKALGVTMGNFDALSAIDLEKNTILIDAGVILYIQEPRAIEIVFANIIGHHFFGVLAKTPAELSAADTDIRLNLQEAQNTSAIFRAAKKFGVKTGNALGTLHTAFSKIRKPDEVPYTSFYSFHGAEEAAKEKLGVPDLIGKRYRPLATLGEGGMGVVLLAFDTVEKKKVAIKIPTFSGISDPAARMMAAQRFKREIELTQGIESPSVIKILNTGTYKRGEEDNSYLVMEYVPWPTLAEWKQHQSLSVVEMVWVTIQVLGGLDAIHERGRIHRDIKPGNILIRPDGKRIVILDLGLAKEVDSDSARTELTVSQAVMGTPHYMAPEQAAGDTKYLDKRADLFSAGVILYEMATGKRPFGEGAKGYLQVALAVSKEDVKPEPPSLVNSAVDEDLEAIILKALEKNAKQRYQNASEFTQDLEEWLYQNATKRTDEIAKSRIAITISDKMKARGPRKAPEIKKKISVRREVKPGAVRDAKRTKKAWLFGGILGGLVASILLIYGVITRKPSVETSPDKIERRERPDTKFSQTGKPVAWESLVAHYTFDEIRPDGTVIDSTGKTIGRNYGATLVPGKIGNALRFDGVGNFVTLGNPPVFDIRQDITLSVWIKINDDLSQLKEHSHIIEKGSQYILDMQSGKMRFTTLNEGKFHTVSSDSPFTKNRWHHLVGKKSGKNMTLWVDGVQQKNTVSESAITPNEDSVEIGRSLKFGDRAFKGEIDDIRVYKKALSDEEIKEIFQGDQKVAPPAPVVRKPVAAENLVAYFTFDEIRPDGTVVDASKGLVGKVHGATIVPGKIGNALRFDGVKDYLSLGNPLALDITGDFTLSAWIKLLDDGKDRLVQPIISKGNFQYELKIETNRLSVNIYDSKAKSTDDPEKKWPQSRHPENMKTNLWIHVVGSKSGPDFNLWVDGVRYTQQGIGSISSTKADVEIGRNHDLPDRLFHGDIDDVRIYNRALSDAEIKEIFEQGSKGLPDAKPAEGKKPPKDGARLADTSVSRTPVTFSNIQKDSAKLKGTYKEILRANGRVNAKLSADPVFLAQEDLEFLRAKLGEFKAALEKEKSNYPDIRAKYLGSIAAALELAEDILHKFGKVGFVMAAIDFTELNKIGQTYDIPGFGDLVRGILSERLEEIVLEPSSDLPFDKRQAVAPYGSNILVVNAPIPGRDLNDPDREDRELDELAKRLARIKDEVRESLLAVIQDPDSAESVRKKYQQADVRDRIRKLARSLKNLKGDGTPEEKRAALVERVKKLQFYFAHGVIQLPERGKYLVEGWDEQDGAGAFTHKGLHDLVEDVFSRESWETVRNFDFNLAEGVVPREGIQFLENFMRAHPEFKNYSPKDLLNIDNWTSPQRRSDYREQADVFFIMRRLILQSSLADLRTQFQEAEELRNENEIVTLRGPMSALFQPLLEDLKIKLEEKIQELILLEKFKEVSSLYQSLYQLVEGATSSSEGMLFYTDKAARIKIKNRIKELIEQGPTEEVRRSGYELLDLHYGLLQRARTNARPMYLYRYGKLPRPMHVYKQLLVEAKKFEGRGIGAYEKAIERLEAALKHGDLTEERRSFPMIAEFFRTEFIEYSSRWYQAFAYAYGDPRLPEVIQEGYTHEIMEADAAGRLNEAKKNIRALRRGDTLLTRKTQPSPNQPVKKRTKRLEEVENALTPGVVVAKGPQRDDIRIAIRDKDGDYRLFLVELGHFGDVQRTYPPDRRDSVIHEILLGIRETAGRYAGKEDMSDLWKQEEFYQIVERVAAAHHLGPVPKTEKIPLFGKKSDAVERMPVYKWAEHGSGVYAVSSRDQVLIQKNLEEPFELYVFGDRQAERDFADDVRRKGERLLTKLGAIAIYGITSKKNDAGNAREVQDWFDFMDNLTADAKLKSEQAEVRGERKYSFHISELELESHTKFFDKKSLVRELEERLREIKEGEEPGGPQGARLADGVPKAISNGMVNFIHSTLNNFVRESESSGIPLKKMAARPDIVRDLFKLTLGEADSEVLRPIKEEPALYLIAMSLYFGLFPEGGAFDRHEITTWVETFSKRMSSPKAREKYNEFKERFRGEVPRLLDEAEQVLDRRNQEKDRITGLIEGGSAHVVGEKDILALRRLYLPDDPDRGDFIYGYYLMHVGDIQGAKKVFGEVVARMSFSEYFKESIIELFRIQAKERGVLPLEKAAEELESALAETPEKINVPLMVDANALSKTTSFLERVLNGAINEENLEGSVNRRYLENSYSPPRKEMEAVRELIKAAAERGVDHDVYEKIRLTALRHMLYINHEAEIIRDVNGEEKARDLRKARVEIKALKGEDLVSALDLAARRVLQDLLPSRVRDEFFAKALARWLTPPQIEKTLTAVHAKNLENQASEANEKARKGRSLRRKEDSRKTAADAGKLDEDSQTRMVRIQSANRKEREAVRDLIASLGSAEAVLTVKAFFEGRRRFADRVSVLLSAKELAAANAGARLAGITTASDQGGRDEQQDTLLNTHVTVEIPDGSGRLLAVFDGHGDDGEKAAQFARDRTKQFFKEAMVHFKGDKSKSLRRTAQKIHVGLREEWKAGRIQADAGTMAVIVFIPDLGDRGQVEAGWVSVGDSLIAWKNNLGVLKNAPVLNLKSESERKAVLDRARAKGYKISELPDNKQELSEEVGSLIHAFSVSRSLGDFHRPYFMHTPRSGTMTLGRQSAVILASDGLFLRDLKMALNTGHTAQDLVNAASSDDNRTAIVWRAGARLAATGRSTASPAVREAMGSRLAATSGLEDMTPAQKRFVRHFGPQKKTASDILEFVAGTRELSSIHHYYTVEKMKVIPRIPDPFVPEADQLFITDKHQITLVGKEHEIVTFFVESRENQDLFRGQVEQAMNKAARARVLASTEQGFETKELKARGRTILVSREVDESRRPAPNLEREIEGLVNIMSRRISQRASERFLKYSPYLHNELGPRFREIIDHRSGNPFFIKILKREFTKLPLKLAKQRTAKNGETIDALSEFAREILRYAESTPKGSSGARLTKNFIGRAEDTDPETLILIARSLLDIKKISKTLPFEFELGNALITGELDEEQGTGTVYFYNVGNDGKPVGKPFTQVKLTEKIVEQARALKDRESAIRVKMIERSEALEAFADDQKATGTARQFYNQLKKSNALDVQFDNNRTVVLRFVTEKKLRPEKIELYRKQLQTLHSIAGKKVRLQFAQIGRDGIPVFYGSSDPDPAKGEDFALFHLSELSEEGLKAAEALGAGFVSVPDLADDETVIPFVAQGVFLAAVGRLSGYTDSINQLWNNVRGADAFMRLDPESFDDIRKVRKIDLDRYSKLQLRTIARIAWEKVLEYTRLALQALGAAA